jgi:hypothetical protein
MDVDVDSVEAELNAYTHQKKMPIINLKLISGKYAQKNEISG